MNPLKKIITSPERLGIGEYQRAIRVLDQACIDTNPRLHGYDPTKEKEFDWRGYYERREGLMDKLKSFVELLGAQRFSGIDQCMAALMDIGVEYSRVGGLESFFRSYKGLNPQSNPELFIVRSTPIILGIPIPGANLTDLVIVEKLPTYDSIDYARKYVKSLIELTPILA